MDYDDKWTVEGEIESTLKPCPRCGIKAILEDGTIRCDECGMWSGEDMELEEAISWWNEQPLVDALQARIAELEAELFSAKRWGPVVPEEDGSWQRLKDGVYLVGKLEGNTPNDRIEIDGNGGLIAVADLIGKAIIFLPKDIRLCRHVAEQGKTKSEST